MPPESDDPTVIRSIAVQAEDLVAALESGRRSGRDAVLRVTPPFSGRMRARLHAGETDVDIDPAPVHVDPDTLVGDDLPPYPDPADTEDELRADPAVEYTRDRHHERHADAVEEWRASVPDHAVDTVELETETGRHTVDVTLLG